MIKNYNKIYKLVLSLIFLVAFVFIYSHIYNHHFIAQDCQDGVICSVVNSYNNFTINDTNISNNFSVKYLYINIIIYNVFFNLTLIYNLHSIRAPPYTK